jgi:DNA-binding LacI/PurR family transcriptional regulator
VVSIKDIAKIAGCNVSTVSRALNGSREVSEPVKQKIRAIAQELHYRPNYSARALVGKGLNTIGVIVPEFNSNHFAQLIGFIEPALKQRNYSLLLGLTHHKLKEEIECMMNMVSRGVNGIILSFPLFEELQDQLELLQEQSEIPFVITQPRKTFDHFDCVLVDDDYGYRQLIGHLYENGHRRIGFVGDLVSSTARLACCKSAAKTYGVELTKDNIIVSDCMYEEAGYRGMNRLLDTSSRLPTAIVASYDYVALGAARALRERSIRVPEDMSLVGYDNIRETSYLSHPLTTLAPPYKQIAETAVSILLERIQHPKDKEPRHIRLESELVIRSSVAPAPEEKPLE